MKVTAYALGLLGILAACAEPTVDYADLVTRDGKMFEKFSNTPYSGLTTGTVVGTLRDGLWDGERLKYSATTGNLMGVTNYVNGVQNGSSLFYSDDGILLKKWEYTMGSWVRETGYNNGYVTYDIEWQNGEKHGTHKQYHAYSDQLWYSREFSEGIPASNVLLTSGNGLELDDPSLIVNLEIPLKANYAHGKVVAVSNPQCFAEYADGVAKMAGGAYSKPDEKRFCAHLIERSIPIQFRK
jgi:antitoxin component YwqK of YwqJK toxin-antitoxin module